MTLFINQDPQRAVLQLECTRKKNSIFWPRKTIGKYSSFDLSSGLENKKQRRRIKRILHLPASKLSHKASLRIYNPRFNTAYMDWETSNCKLNFQWILVSLNLERGTHSLKDYPFNPNLAEFL